VSRTSPRQINNQNQIEEKMRTLSCLISGLLLLAPALQTTNARQQTDKQTSNIEQVKIKIAKLGVGDKARATITTNDGAKTKAISIGPAMIISKCAIARQARPQLSATLTWRRSTAIVGIRS
jgi:hypothetical protein